MSIAAYANDIRAVLWSERATQNGQAWPVQLRLDLSERCNLKCAHCEFPRIREDMSLPFAARIFEALPWGPTGVQSFSITGGGEPLINPDALEIIELYAQRFRIGLITNGTLATTHEDWDRLAQACDWIRVSLDAATVGEYRRRHNAGLALWSAATKTVTELAKRIGSSRLKLISVGSILLKDTTMSAMWKQARLARSLGAGAILFRPEWGLRRDFTWALRGVRRMVRSSTFEVVWPGRISHMASPPPLPKKCYALLLQTVITAGGQVWPCARLRYSPAFESLGNLSERTFGEVWNGGQRRRLLDLLPTPSACPQICCHYGLNTQMARVMERIEEAKPHCYFA